MKKADEDDEVISDWKFAAMVVDRLDILKLSYMVSSRALGASFAKNHGQRDSFYSEIQGSDPRFSRERNSSEIYAPTRINLTLCEIHYAQSLDVNLEFQSDITI